MVNIVLTEFDSVLTKQSTYAFIVDLFTYALVPGRFIYLFNNLFIYRLSPRNCFSLMVNAELNNLLLLIYNYTRLASNGKHFHQLSGRNLKPQANSTVLGWKGGEGKE